MCVEPLNMCAMCMLNPRHACVESSNMDVRVLNIEPSNVNARVLSAEPLNASSTLRGSHGKKRLHHQHFPRADTELEQKKASLLDRLPDSGRIAMCVRLSVHIEDVPHQQGI